MSTPGSDRSRCVSRSLLRTVRVPLPAVGCGRASNAALRADREAPATRCRDKTPLYAASIAGMALGCLPGNASSAVATAAIAANTQADRKT